MADSTCSNQWPPRSTRQRRARLQQTRSQALHPPYDDRQQMLQRTGAAARVSGIPVTVPAWPLPSAPCPSEDLLTSVVLYVIGAPFPAASRVRGCSGWRRGSSTSFDRTSTRSRRCLAEDGVHLLVVRDERPEVPQYPRGVRVPLAPFLPMYPQWYGRDQRRELVARPRAPTPVDVDVVGS